MSAKDNYQKFSAILKKEKVNFFLEAILFLRTNGTSCYFKHNLLFVLNANVCTLERTHERGNRLCVLHSLHGLPGQRC